ncbi:M1 family metallopeptidase [soil metagenome]
MSASNVERASRGPRPLWVMIVVGCTSAQQPPPVGPAPDPALVVAPRPRQDIVPVPVPVPVAGEAVPTLRLPRLFMPTGYAARLAIDPAKPTFEGDIQIAGTLSTATSVIWLHGRQLAVKHATATGSAGVPTELHVTPRGEDLLELRSEGALPPGAWTIALAYTGQIDAVNTTGMFVETSGGAKYIFSQFEALYARRVFPCLDEPDSKVPWQLTLDVPKGLVAVANTPVTKESEAGASHHVEFAVTKPLPAYLVAFGVGPFDIVPAGVSKSGTPIRIVTFKGRGAEVAYAAKHTATIVDLLETWFAMPYPFPKLDLLSIPVTSGFGAMENPGLVTFTESVFLLEDKPSWARRSEFISVASHELAHQWFGDLVTTAWWDDIWLNEGFANWMEHKITAEFAPSWHFDQHEVTMRASAMTSDSLVTARRIRQPIAVQDDILNVFDGITYNKGGAVLNMFESYVGSDVFQRGVRAYMKAHAYGNASSADFIAAVSKASGKDLAPAFNSFLDQPGEPELEATLGCTGSPHVDLAQHRLVPAGAPAVAATKPWVIPVCIAFEKNGTRAETCTLLDAPTGTLALPTKSCPRWVMPNVNGRGYYRVHYTAKQATTLRDEAWPLLSWSERRALFSDLNADMHAARPGFHDAVPTKTPLVLVLSYVPRLLASGYHSVIEDALRPSDDVARLVADDQRAKYEAWYRMTYGPGATKLGFTPKDSDDYETEALRSQLLGAAAFTGRDPDLVKQAIELAGHWHEVPEGVRNLVMIVAVDASPEVAARAIAAVRTEQNQASRTTLIMALSQQRDPRRLAQALPLLLDASLDLRETIDLLFGTSTEATRAIAEQFYRDHAAELAKRMPRDEVSGGLFQLVQLFTSACDPARRDAIVSEVKARFGGEPGAQRVIAQTTEGLDQCIANKLALVPEVRAWLGGLKIPRPADKPKAAEKAAPAVKQPAKRSSHKPK